MLWHFTTSAFSWKAGRMMIITNLFPQFSCWDIQLGGAASSQWPWRQEREAEPWIINDNIQPVPSLDIKHSGSGSGGVAPCQLNIQLLQDTRRSPNGLKMLYRTIKSPPSHVVFCHGDGIMSDSWVIIMLVILLNPFLLLTQQMAG